MKNFILIFSSGLVFGGCTVCVPAGEPHIIYKNGYYYPAYIKPTYMTPINHKPHLRRASQNQINQNTNVNININTIKGEGK